MPPKKRQKGPQKNDINHKCKIRKCKAGDSSKSKCKELVFDPTLQTKDNFANCCNIVNILDGIQRSNKSFYSVRKACRNVLINKISRLSVYKRESPFDRRVTVIEWHPKNPRLLAAASKGGDILLWNYEKFTPEQLIVGLGPGGSIQAIKFHPENEVEFYTASIDGQVVSRNFQDRTCKIFLETQDFDKWYTSLDVSIKNRHIVAGDNTGYLTMLSLEGEQLSKTRLHKNKITHAEFNVKQPWLLTTASIDRTVKLWDIRHLTKDALTVLHHDYGVNSAYFSLTDASRILTTDQKSQLRIYRGPLWDLETIIHHPHRQFQHLTPIKATWHPLEDVVVVGRYPDKKFPGYTSGELRTIDFFDADTGKHQYGLFSSDLNGICSLNRFNVLGDILATGMGVHTIIWNAAFQCSMKAVGLSLLRSRIMSDTTLNNNRVRV